MNYAYINEPVFIIGAARSGTKMLRAAIASSQEFVFFPYDINYIWKYGNYHINHDELTPSNLNQDIIDYIHKQFSKLAKNQKNKKILEKTVSNSLRIDFIKAVFPSCKLIHIIRDGRDVAESARRCWMSPPDIKYIIKKAIKFPIKDSALYAYQYVKNYLNLFLSSEKKTVSWGPRFKGIDELLQKYSLIEICGMQWLRCVKSALESLEKLGSEEYIQVKYEDLVSNPQHELIKIINFLKIKNHELVEDFAIRNITSKNVGKWKTNLSREDKELLIRHIEPMLIKLGYVEER